MRSKLHFSFIVCLLSFAVAALFACEDNPEECYSDKDCGEGYWCEATYYNSGSRSGGICHKIDSGVDGGETEVGDATADANEAAIQDSSQAPPVVEASTEAATGGDATVDAQEASVSGDADLEVSTASEASITDSDATVEDGATEGGQPTPPADSGNVDSAN